LGLASSWNQPPLLEQSFFPQAHVSGDRRIAAVGFLLIAYLLSFVSRKICLCNLDLVVEVFPAA
jgi:hypothetical protein